MAFGDSAKFPRQPRPSVHTIHANKYSSPHHLTKQSVNHCTVLHLAPHQSRLAMGHTTSREQDQRSPSLDNQGSPSSTLPLPRVGRVHLSGG
ncbi:hypothetical protein GE21DRAFT_1252999 [Neurospora crassa]|nr:hypothetical protein GE21DRAFT_1252999 [Neurospora crassa]